MLLTAVISIMISVPGWVPPPPGVWRPPPKAAEILSRQEDEISAGGARGGMKTETGLVWMVEPEYIENSRYKGLMVRVDRKDLVDCWERSKYLYTCLGAKFSGHPSQGAAFVRFPAGGYIMYGHLNDENAYQQYMSSEFHKINFEQIEQCPSEELYVKLLSCSRSSVPGLVPRTYVSWNPGGVGHQWIVRRFHRLAYNKTYWYKSVVKLPDGREIVSWKSRIHIPTFVWDNPYIDPAYLANLNQLPETWRQAWLYGNVDIMAGQYLSMLDRSRHVIPYFDPHPQWYKFRSLDWGHFHHTACGWFATDFEGNAYLYRFLKTKGESIPRLARHILDMTPEESQISCTVAGRDLWEHLVEQQDQNPTTRADLMASEGLQLIQAQTDRVNGWQNLIARLDWKIEDEKGPARRPTLYIMDNCAEAYDDLCLLIHDEKHPEDVKKMPGDDTGDMIRYGARHIHSLPAPKKPKTEMDNVFDRLASYDKPKRAWGAEYAKDAWGGLINA